MIVGILGLGTLGRALAAGLRSHPSVERVLATTRTPREQDDCPDAHLVSDNTTLARESDVILMCVKPFQVKDAAQEIAPACTPEKLLISTATSITVAQLRAWTRERLPVVRTMPNVCVRVGAGMTVVAIAPGAGDDHLRLAVSLFETLGRVATIEERLMHAATGISGCGPAYVYMIIESLSEAGVKLGLPRNTALLLSAQTLLGAATMALESGIHPAALRDEVTTPAGCTVDALLELEDGRLRSTLVRAAVAAAARSESLNPVDTSAIP